MDKAFRFPRVKSGLPAPPTLPLGPCSAFVAAVIPSWEDSISSAAEDRDTPKACYLSCLWGQPGHLDILCSCLGLSVVLTRNSSLVLATSADNCFGETGAFQIKRKSGFVENSWLSLSGILFYLVGLSPANFGENKKKKKRGRKSISSSFKRTGLLLKAGCL